jgi:hypothetical protein
MVMQGRDTILVHFVGQRSDLDGRTVRPEPQLSETDNEYEKAEPARWATIQ